MSSTLLQENGIGPVAFDTSLYHKERLNGHCQKGISRRMNYMADTKIQAAQGSDAADVLQLPENPRCTATR